MKALIDGDIIAYSCGFASDKKEVLPDGTKVTKSEPVEYALHSVKQLINRVMENSKATEKQVYLTGKGNYREKLATIKVYKGNRDVSHKPTWFNEIKFYLKEHQGAIVIDNKEADDALGTEQWKDFVASGGKKEEVQTCIATIDKDLNMIPGWHYNWRQDVLYWVDPDDAELFFYTQLLTGDKTDNIVGVPKVGPKTAEKILSKGMTPRQMYSACLEAYRKHYGDAGKEYLMENAHLLWIQREPDKLWEVPN